MWCLCLTALALSGPTLPSQSKINPAVGHDRRLFLGAAAAAAAATLAAPLQPARAASIEEIAARNNAIAKQERDAGPPPEPEGDGGKSLVPIALGASVVLSVPFYWKNLARLGIKLSGGGDGYDKIQ